MIAGQEIRMSDGARAELPEIDDMLDAGVPLSHAFTLWGKMMREPDRPPSFWWTVLRLWRQEARLLQ